MAVKSVETPPLALALAAEAIGDMPRLSTAEELARAALDAAWALVRLESRMVTHEEIALIRELVARHYTHVEIAGLMGCNITRIDTATRIGNIRADARGRRGEERHPRGLDGLVEVVRKARGL